MGVRGLKQPQQRPCSLTGQGDRTRESSILNRERTTAMSLPRLNDTVTVQELRAPNGFVKNLSASAVNAKQSSARWQHTSEAGQLVKAARSSS